MRIVLGIETSCDDTGIAIYDGERGLLAHQLYSQTTVHQPFGGVVPELAARDHIQKILPLLQQTLRQANLDKRSIEGIAYTAGPGLLGALLVGAAVGRSLGWAWNIPTLGIHHMEGHLLAPLLDEPKPPFPFIALLVSGGHTQLIDVNGIGQYQLLGQTLDDAVGEAFDKSAKLLGLGYPGGPALAQLAARGNPKRFCFPRPMLHKGELDFSFSGLKTCVLRTWQTCQQTDQDRADIACAFQAAAVDILVHKCQRALAQTHRQRLVVAGGVSANQRLRDTLHTQLGAQGYTTFFPRTAFCTDNGAMIAYAGYLRLQAGQRDTTEICARARWDLQELSEIPCA